jgi:plasmid replication initiation protein
MQIDLNTAGTIASIISLVLAFVFWRLADRQADRAEKTLNELRDKMLSWQNDINTAAINLIQAQPEVIALKVSLEETANNSAFMNRLADTVENLVNEADEKTIGYKMAIVDRLLAHQKSMVIERDQIKANVIAGRKESQSGQ